MILQYTCDSIDRNKWNELMKGAKPLDYKWLIDKLKIEFPKIYKSMRLDLYNPYSNMCVETKNHYILTHSAIEYFFTK